MNEYDFFYPFIDPFYVTDSGLALVEVRLRSKAGAPYVDVSL